MTPCSEGIFKSAIHPSYGDCKTGVALLSDKNSLMPIVIEYHVSCTAGKISVGIKIGITFIFRFHRRPMQLVVIVPVALLSFLRQILGDLVGCRNFFCRLAWLEHNLIEWDDGET